MKSNRRLCSLITLFTTALCSLSLHKVLANDDSHKKLARAEKLAWLHNWGQARPLYEAAEEELTAAGDLRNAALSRIGSILSRIYTTDSLELLAQIDQELRRPPVYQDHNLKLRCLAAKAYLEEQPDLLASRESWSQVLELARQIGDKDWETRASGHLGIFLWVIDIDSVGATRQVGEALVDAIGSSDLSAQVWFQKDVGNVLCLMRRFEAAMNFFQKALTSAHLDKDSPFPSDVYIGKARGLIQMGKVKEAQALADQVLQAASGISDHNAVAEALILRARALPRQDFTERVSLLNRAISLAEKNHYQRTLADALEEMASLYQTMGDSERAEEYQARCIEVTRARHDGYSLPERFSRLAEIYIKRGRISDASALYEQVTDVTEALLINSPSPYAKASLIDWLSDIFTNHFKLVLNQLKDADQALSILERARGRTLAEAIRSKLIEPSKEKAQSPAAAKELSALNSKLLEARTTPERKELLDQLFMAEQRMAPMIAQENAYFRNRISKPASLRSVQSILRPRELLLEFVLSEPHSYCLQITQDGISVRELAGRSALDSLIDQYLYEVRHQQSAIEISKKLFAELLGGVEDLERYSLLTIVPDQNLHLLPFESLRNAEAQLLLESHTIGYVQSATVLHLLRTLPHEKGQPTQTLLAIGDAVYSTESKYTIERGPLSVEGAELQRLPYTAKEVLAIADLFPGKSLVLTGKSATEANLKALHPLSQYSLLHFAVHGFANERFPERSALVLTIHGNSGEDGLLQDREIIAMDLSAELVTLSACDSGFGKLGQEGISSLVKAFMLAGARSVVASLWSVDDTMSVRLMREFYSRLAAGETKGSALRNAKLSVLKEKPSLSPYYWAGFTHWGDGISTIGQFN